MNQFIINKNIKSKLITATLCLLISASQASAISLGSICKSTISAVSKTLNNSKVIKTGLALSAASYVFTTLLPYVFRDRDEDQDFLNDRGNVTEDEMLPATKTFIKNTLLHVGITGAIYALSPLALNVKYVYPLAAICALGLPAYKLGKIGVLKAKEYFKQDEY